MLLLHSLPAIDKLQNNLLKSDSRWIWGDSENKAVQELVGVLVRRTMRAEKIANIIV